MKQKELKERNLNGYRAIYKPDWPTAYTSSNWVGFVYEHRYLMEREMGRSLRDDEIVHHLDGNPWNNRISNLIVLSNAASHMRLHYWIDTGSNMHAAYTPSTRDDKYFCEQKETKYCKMCNTTLQYKQELYCSEECTKLDWRTTERPSKEDLIRMVKDMGYSEVGRLYNVSDNAIRKWMKAYNVNPKTLENL